MGKAYFCGEPSMTQDQLKRAVAEAALAYVEKDEINKIIMLLF